MSRCDCVTGAWWSNAGANELRVFDKAGGFVRTFAKCAARDRRALGWCVADWGAVDRSGRLGLAPDGSLAVGRAPLQALSFQEATKPTGSLAFGYPEPPDARSRILALMTVGLVSPGAQSTRFPVEWCAPAGATAPVQFGPQSYLPSRASRLRRIPVS
jgi:hypothetical protein